VYRKIKREDYHEWMRRRWERQALELQQKRKEGKGKHRKRK
jgi:hypothetical protein